MAAKKVKAKAKAHSAKKTNGGTKRDGACAKAWSAFEKCGDATDTSKMLAAAEKLGVNPATAKTQLYKFRKEKGIKGSGKKGRPAAKTAKAKKPAKAKKAKKPAENKSAPKATTAPRRPASPSVTPASSVVEQAEAGAA